MSTVMTVLGVLATLWVLKWIGRGIACMWRRNRLFQNAVDCAVCGDTVGFQQAIDVLHPECPGITREALVNTILGRLERASG